MFICALTLSDWGIIATIASAIIALLLAYLTFRNVNLTKKTVEEMKLAREENSRPFITAGYEVNDKRFVYFYIENLGASPAININVFIKKPIKLKNGMDIQSKIFDKPIKYLAPKEKINTVIFPTWEIPEENTPYAENSVEVKYFDVRGEKQYKEEYDIGIKPYVESLYIDSLTINDLVKEMKKLNEILEENMKES